MKTSLIKQTLHFFISLLIVSSVVSCGDSPFLSDEKPSGEVGGISGVSVSDSKLLLGGLEFIPRYAARVKLYENNELNLIFMNEFGELKDPGNTLFLKLWMPDHGHGSFPIELTRVQEGVYKAEKLFFTMPGYWDLHIQLKDGDSIVEEVLWAIEL